MDWDAIMFDCDGVILDSVETKTKAFEKSYLPYGTENMKKGVDYHLKNGGVSRFKKFNYFFDNILNKPISETEIIQLGKQFSQYVFDEILKADFIDGALETIQALNKFAIPLYVISGTPDEELKDIFEKRNLSHYFNEIHGSPKQKYDIISEIIMQHNYINKRCLFIGDAMTDYNAAYESDIAFMGIVKDQARSPFPDKTIIYKRLSIENIMS